MAFFEGTLKNSPVSNARPQAKADYILSRIGCAGRQPIRLNDAATEQANRDLLDLFTNDIKNWCQDYFIAEDQAASNPDLSPAGIEKMLEPVRRKFNASFNELATRCRTLQNIHMAKVNEIEAATDTPPAGDKVLLFLQCQEIRSYLSTLPPAQVMNLLVESDDFMIILAIETAPSCLNILPDEMLKRGKMARTKRLHGKALVAMADENATLTRINEWLNAIPKVLDFVSIVPNLWPLPDSVYETFETPEDPAE